MQVARFLRLLSKSIYPLSAFYTLFDDKDQENLDICRCREIIRTSNLIDWESYLLRYPDVANNDLNPKEHFLNNGIFEGRKIFCKRLREIGQLSENRNRTCCLSVIIPNYNNALYLPKALESVIKQTVRDLEIIIIDDASTDNSLEIIKDYASIDNRIKPFAFKRNRSQHMARKFGVEISIGNFIMFLDSDDFYVEDACQRALAEISEGYDIVTFNSNVIFPTPACACAQQGLVNWMQSHIYGSFFGLEIMEQCYISKKINRYINSKIYDASLLKKSFSLMENGNYPRGQDEYEVFVILSNALSLKSVDYAIYNYHANIGIATARKATLQRFFTTGEIPILLANYADRHGGHDYLGGMINGSLDKSVTAFFDLVDAASTRHYFELMGRQYGIIRLMDYLIDKYTNDWQMLSRKFSNYPLETRFTSPKKICFMYSNLGTGGVQNLIYDFTNILANHSYDVHILLTGGIINPEMLNSRIKISFVAPPGYKKDSFIEHINQLYITMQTIKPDLVIANDCWTSALIWQIILLHYMDIPIFVIQHTSFYSRIIFSDSFYPIQDIDSVYSCADKLICLSRDSELYYRRRGVNAQCIYHPLREVHTKTLPFSTRKDKIIVVCRMDEKVKQIEDSLLILEEIVKVRPSVQMYFIGSFKKESSRENFINKIRDKKLLNNVHLTGWMPDPGVMADESALLLSTSLTESFGLAICEAQAHGLPCVIYDLSIPIAEGNPAIIKAPQGDIKQAAKEILNLLADEQRWFELSNVAREQAKRFTSHKWLQDFITLLNEFQTLSRLSCPAFSDYRQVIKTMGFFGGQPAPWEK